MSTQRNVTRAGESPVICKFCGNWEAIVRYGRTAKSVQRYLCRKCRRTFLDNRAPERMRYSYNVITSALNRFYEGTPLQEVRRQIKLDFGVIPDPSTVRDWLFRYTRKAIAAFRSVQPRPGDTWVVGETLLKVRPEGGQTMWLFDCLDEDTRFLLASHLATARDARNVLALMQKADKRTGKAPKVIFADRLARHLTAAKEATGEPKQGRGGTLRIERSGKSIQHLHATLKDRSRVVRGLADSKTARLLIEGWGIHYNFFRPHPELGDKTPAQAAMTDAPYTGWAEVLRAR